MTAQTQQPDGYQSARRNMIAEQIEARGVHDPRVLSAIAFVPRERFVPGDAQSLAYSDQALAIEEHQTISQPFMVAFMTQALRVEAHSKVLEIGTGSGYQAAVLSRLTDRLYSIERHAELSETAARRLRELGVTGVRLRVGDGSLGWADAAPFDRIMVTAAAPTIPQALLDQLVDGGRLIIPVGGAGQQTLVSVVNFPDRTRECPLIPCRFVKLMGQAGWT